MPRLSCWFVKASFVYLLAGFTLGGLILFNKGVPLYPALWRVLPSHIEFLLLGWVVQLAMGVAFWILPRFGGSRGNVKAAWVAFFLLNAGLLLTGVGSALGAPMGLFFLGRLLEAGAVVAFGVHAWPRVKPLSVFSR